MGFLLLYLPIYGRHQRHRGSFLHLSGMKRSGADIEVVF